MLKILQIIPNLRKGGAERFVIDICNELHNREGVSVKLVAFSNLNEYNHLSKNVDWQVVSAKYIPSITKKSIREVSELQKLMDNYQPDIIHTHLWMAEIISRQVNYDKAKWFSHFHDNMKQLNKKFFPVSKEKITNLYERRLMLTQYKKYNNNFICISNDTFNYAKKNLPHGFKNNIVFLKNAINVKNFTKPNNYKKQNTDQLKLITIGSLVDKKNHIFLINVVNILKKNKIKVKLHVLGNGYLKEELQKKINRNELTEEIILCGNVHNPQEYLWQSDIYIHSAYYEPFGLVLIEAMAAGVPVITLDGKGNRDLIEEGKNGYMIFEQNAEKFAEKIINLFKDNDKYKEISEYCKEYAKQYDVKLYVDRLLELYHSKLK